MFYGAGIIGTLAYGAVDWLIAAVVTGGVSEFLLTGPTAAPTDTGSSVTGYLDLLAYSVLDGLASTMQEKLFTEHKTSKYNQMMYVNLFSACSSLILRSTVRCRTDVAPADLSVDASGDFDYQAVDACSLTMVFWLLRRVLADHPSTYREEQDPFPVMPAVLVALELATEPHANTSARPIFGTCWMAGPIISAAAVVPQLWLCTVSGGRVEALTSHYAAAMALGRALSGIFKRRARFDITCVPWAVRVSLEIWPRRAGPPALTSETCIRTRVAPSIGLGARAGGGEGAAAAGARVLRPRLCGWRCSGSVASLV